MIKFILGLTYFVLVVVCAYLVSTRAPSRQHAVAAQALLKNHQLELRDLLPANYAALQGKFLRTSVEDKSPITEDMVAAESQSIFQTNGIAAFVAIEKRRAVVQNINVGSSVQICVKQKPFGATTKVEALQCDESNCMATVKLGKIDNQVIDPASLTDATIIPAASNCETK